MATINLPLLDVSPSSSSGLKLGYLGLYLPDGSIDKGLKRGFGGPVATNGVGNTTNKLVHDAVTETYDDEWTVQNIAVDDSPAVDLTATVVAYMKKMEIFVLPADHGSTGGIYIGPTNAVTGSTSVATNRGRYLPPGSSYLMPIGSNRKVWAICATGLVANIQVVQYA